MGGDYLRGGDGVARASPRHRPERGALNYDWHEQPYVVFAVLTLQKELAGMYESISIAKGVRIDRCFVTSI